MNELTPRRIIGLLEEKGMSQRELAQKIGVQESTISRYIAGQRTPHTVILSKIAEILETTMDYLLGKSDSPSLRVSESSILHLSPESIEMAKRIEKLDSQKKNFMRDALKMAENSKTPDETSVTREKQEVI